MLDFVLTDCEFGDYESCDASNIAVNQCYGNTFIQKQCCETCAFITSRGRTNQLPYLINSKVYSKYLSSSVKHMSNLLANNATYHVNKTSVFGL